MVYKILSISLCYSFCGVFTSLPNMLKTDIREIDFFPNRYKIISIYVFIKRECVYFARIVFIVFKE